MRCGCHIVLATAGMLVFGGCRTMPCGPSIVAKPCAEARAWAGIYPTTLATWTCHGQVDVPALTAQLEDQWAGGVHGVLVLGTLGEGEIASDEDREIIIETAVRSARGRGPVIVGIHTGDTTTALCHLNQAARLGAAAVLVKVPGPRPFVEVRHHVATLAGQNLLPVFYYHYPQRTRLRLTPGEVAELLLLPGVLGIKESTLDLKEVSQHMELTREKAVTFLSGTALNLTQFLALGGHGAMCPEAVLVPRATVDCQAMAMLSPAAGREQQRRLFACAPVLMGFPVQERTARALTMAMQDRHWRQPMLGEPEPARLKAALQKLGLPVLPLVKPPFHSVSAIDEFHLTRSIPRLAEWRCLPYLEAPDAGN